MATQYEKNGSLQPIIFALLGMMVGFFVVVPVAAYFYKTTYTLTCDSGFQQTVHGPHMFRWEQDGNSWNTTDSNNVHFTYNMKQGESCILKKE